MNDYDKCQAGILILYLEHSFDLPVFYKERGLSDMTGL